MPSAESKPPESAAIDPTTALFSVKPIVVSDTVRKTALQAVLLPELLAIVIGYAVDNRRYSFPSIHTAAIRTTDAKAASWRVDNSRRYRLVATQAIHTDGPRRWRILTEFRSDQVGYIAVGITKAAAGSSFAGYSWQNIASSDDILITTTNCHIVQYVPNARIYHAGWKIAARGFQKSVERQSITLVEFDSKQRKMTVTFRDLTGTIRQIDAVLPVPSSASWRPCITVADNVDATIMSWPDDVDLPAVDGRFRVDL